MYVCQVTKCNKVFKIVIIMIYDKAYFLWVIKNISILTKKFNIGKGTKIVFSFSFNEITKKSFSK